MIISVLHVFESPNVIWSHILPKAFVIKASKQKNVIVCSLFACIGSLYPCCKDGVGLPKKTGSL